MAGETAESGELRRAAITLADRHHALRQFAALAAAGGLDGVTFCILARQIYYNRLGNIFRRSIFHTLA